MDSVPIVCLTGQVPTHMIGNDAFQEADTVGITRPCTKHNYLVKRPEDLAPRDARGVPRRALRPARPGRRRPAQEHPDGQGALLGAKDAGPRTAPTTRAREPDPARSSRRSSCWPRRRAADLLCRRRRRQLRAPRPAQLLTELVRATGYPITLTLMGLGAYPGLRPAVRRHARHARHLRGQPRDARLRRDGLHRRPLRRPGDRPARRLLAALAEDPRRHRPVLDQQERRRSTSRSWATPSAALEALLGGLAAALEPGPTAARHRALVGADRASGRRRTACATARTADAIKPQYAIQRLYEADQATATPTSRPTSASTRCGRPSTSSSSSRCAG